MKSFLLGLFLIPFISFGQSFTNFKWDDKEIIFNSVEMKVTDGITLKQIFKGYKDSQIKIYQILSDDPLKAMISVKCSGYFQIDNAEIVQFKFENKEGDIDITYLLQSGTKMCSVLISLEANINKPKFIVVVGTDDYTKKPMKQLNFTLTGIE
jgi:hypothetical protein